MPIINIPSQQTKKWLTSFRGDFFGNLINMFNLNLFTAQGKARVGTKYFPHTVEDDIENMTPVSSYVEAKIYDGMDRPKKVWGVAGAKIIVRSDNDGADIFVKDTSTGIPANDDTGTGSDILSVPDESEEAIQVTEVAIPEGDGGVKITGEGNNVEWAQSFTKVNGPFKELALYIAKGGSPTDNLVIEIQTDNAGVPSGTVLSSLTLDASQFTSSFVLHEYDAEEWSDPTIEFSLDEVYWIVFSRSGSSDTANYILINAAVATEEDDDPYENGELLNYNGSTWDRIITYIKTDTFTADDTWTVPTGITEITVEAWAAGGGGSANVGGGGGGAYSRKVVAVTPAANHLITVGQSVSNDEDGGYSAFGGVEVDLLIVGGGGAGGGSTGSSSRTGGGGGGGEVKELTPAILEGDYAVVIGAGGDGDVDPATSGGDSFFGALFAKGGSFGGRGGVAGGSGTVGGGGGVFQPGGAGSVSHGGNGFAAVNPVDNAGGGGGGAGGNGVNATIAAGGAGGIGVTSSISGSSVVYGAGGGGAGVSTKGAAGGAGAGDGGNSTSAGGGDGTANKGGGGGGGYTSGSANVGGDGGTGVVIIRYPTGSITATGGTITTDGGDTIHTFTTNGIFAVSAVTGAQVLAMGGKSGANGGTGGQAADGIGDTKYDGGDGSLGTGDQGGGGGAGDTAEGGTTGSEIGGQGGELQGGSGGGDFNGEYANGGSMYGGGGSSKTGSAYGSGRGEVRISYEVPLVADYANVSERFFGRSTASTNHQLIVPTSVLAGDLLILIISANGDVDISLSGWTQLVTEDTVFASSTQSVFWKRATGADSGFYSTSATTGTTYIGYRIINGDTPTASIATMDGAPNPPNHNAFELAKYLWIVAGTFSTEGAPINSNPTAPPTDYESFIIEPELFPYDDSGLLGARTMVAERKLEASSENPGPFTGGGNRAVASTIAVPYKLQEQFMDIAMQLQVEFPESAERLYLTTEKDVKFLAEEDSTWYSLWQGVFGQDELDPAYPHPMRLLEAGGVLFVGDGNKLHTMIATGNNTTDANPNRLVFPEGYYINWIAITKSAVFIGLANKLSDDMPSLICYYEPFTEITRIFTIKEGATIGYEQDENCMIVDRAGQMRFYNGTDFKVYDYFPPYFNGEIMNLMHRNGVVVKDSITRFLWEGQYPYACGVWTYDDGRLYHRFGFIFDIEDLNSFGALDPMPSIQWMALQFTDFGTFASAAVRDGANTAIQGIFSDFRRDGVTVSEVNRSNFKTIKFTSPGIDNTWQRIYGKIDDRRAGIQDGALVLKQRYQNSAIGEGYSAPKFNGTWVDDTHFTCNDAAFVAAVDANLIVAGDEVIFRAGMGAGLLAHISAITGTTTKTVTITEGLDDITTGSFTFSVENWRIIANKGVTGKSTPWVQVKAEVRGYIDIEELQVGSTINRDNNE